MTILWVRHADDEYHDITYIHDGKAVGVDLEASKKLYKKMIHVYGEPKHIFCSPFRRTQMTADQMGISKEKITYDIRLSRYFSSREKSHPEVSNDTLSLIKKEKYDMIVNESYSQFVERVRDFRHHIERYRERGQLILCITHTLVIREIALRYKIKFPDHVPFLFTIKTPYKEVHKDRNVKK
jgi:broad specificity phosphatase PhoE